MVVDVLDYVLDELKVLRVAESVLDAVRHVEPVLRLLLLVGLLLSCSTSTLHLAQLP